MSCLRLSLSPAEGPRRALSHSGPQLPPQQRGVRTPDWGGFQGGSWRRSPPTLPATCTRTHLDGKCDVRIGAEASTPVTGAVVEAAACKDSHGVGRAGQGHALGAPSVLPGMALGLQAGQANGPPRGRSPPLGPWVRGAALPSWHPSCCPLAPGPALGHSPTLMAQPRSTASFPASENKHSVRQAGALSLHPLIR